jgi:integrase
MVMCDNSPYHTKEVQCDHGVSFKSSWRPKACQKANSRGYRVNEIAKLNSSEPNQPGQIVGTVAMVANAPGASTALAHAAFVDSPDDWAIGYWLFTVAANSKDTHRAYSKEIRRFRAFLIARSNDFERRDHLVRASYADAAAFVAWVESDDGGPIPDSAGQLLGMGKASLAKPKSTVLHQAITILHGAYTELCSAIRPETNEPCCASNPFAPFRRRYKNDASKQTKTETPDASGVAKALKNEVWDAVWQAACYQSPQESTSPRERKQQARSRLMIAMLRATWERRSAIAGVTLGDIERNRAGIWHIQRERKGKGQMWAPIPAQLVEEIVLFQKTCEITALAANKENSHRSVFWMGDKSAGHSGPINDETLYRCVKSVFAAAARQLEASGEPDLAAQLRQAGAGPHTVRHTMATIFLQNGGSVRMAQATLGHSNADTTTRVYDSKHADEQAQAMEQSWDDLGPGL